MLDFEETIFEAEKGMYFDSGIYSHVYSTKEISQDSQCCCFCSKILPKSKNHEITEVILHSPKMVYNQTTIIYKMHDNTKKIFEIKKC